MSCHDFQLNEVLVCGGCGLGLKVVSECSCDHKGDGDCKCTCKLECCGESLSVKK